MNKNALTIWDNWNDIPKEYQVATEDDLDYVIFVPDLFDAVADEVLDTVAGWRDKEYYEVEDGILVYLRHS